MIDLFVNDLIFVARTLVTGRRMALTHQRMVAAGRQPLYKTRGGKYIRACNRCADELAGKLELMTSDRGKARKQSGCEFCTQQKH